MTSEFDTLEQKAPPAAQTPPRGLQGMPHRAPVPDIPGIHPNALNPHDGPTTKAADHAAEQAHDFVRAKDSPRISASRTSKSFKASEKYRRKSAARGTPTRLSVSATRSNGATAHAAIQKINSGNEKETIIWKPRKPSRWLMQNQIAAPTDARANLERKRLDKRLQSERDAFTGDQARRLAEFRTDD